MSISKTLTGVRIYTTPQILSQLLQLEYFKFRVHFSPQKEQYIELEPPQGQLQETLFKYLNLLIYGLYETSVSPLEQIEQDVEYYNFEIINDYLNPGNPFPDNVATYLLQTGALRRHPSDKYFWIFLKETPEIYNQVLLDETARNSGDLSSIILYFFNINADSNPLTMSSTEEREQYQDYILERSPVRTFENDFYQCVDDNGIVFYSLEKTARCVGYNSGRYRVVFNRKINTKEILFTDEFTYVNSTINYINSILNKHPEVSNVAFIPGVAVCGGWIDTLLHSQDYDAHIERDRYGESIYKDVDIFLFGNISIDETVKKIIRVLLQTNNNLIQTQGILIKDTLNCISIEITRSSPDVSLRYQIIKRIYSSISEILLGFDLDSSAVALHNNKILYLPRYALAVRYGINIVNPLRQSKSFNHRLKKYYERGYSPFIPGKVHKYCGDYYLDIVNYDQSTYNITDLLMKIYKIQTGLILNYDKHISDYSYVSIEEMKRKNSEAYNIIKQRSVESFPYRHVYIHISKELENRIPEDLNVLAEARKKGVSYDMYNSPFRGKVSTDINFIMELLKITKSLDNWKIRNPGTQITGTFNPTNYDYLSPKIDVIN